MKKLSRISQEMGICVQNMAKKYGIMIGREYMGESVLLMSNDYYYCINNMELIKKNINKNSFIG